MDLSSLITGVTGVSSDSLPSKQEIIQDYVLAVVAFWLIGGIVLFIVSKFSKR